MWGVLSGHAARQATGPAKGSVAAGEAKDHRGWKGLIVGQSQREGAGSAVDELGRGRGAAMGTAGEHCGGLCGDFARNCGDLEALCFPCVLFIDIANHSEISNNVNGLIGRSAEI
jgi:hypothetical protein